MSKRTLLIKQIASPIRREESQRATLIGLGFRRMGHVVEVEDTPAVRGMVRKVAHMIEVLEERG